MSATYPSSSINDASIELVLPPPSRLDFHYAGSRLVRKRDGRYTRFEDYRRLDELASAQHEGLRTAGRRIVDLTKSLDAANAEIAELKSQLAYANARGDTFAEALKIVSER
jgi:hypothetical protein